MSNRDTLFSVRTSNLGNWKFDKQVVTVFSDMIQRSVPGYHSIISMIGKLAKHFVKRGTQVYDLGCSIGTVTSSIYSNIFNKKCKIIAVDSSPAMIESCRNHFNVSKIFTPIEIIKCDIRNIDIQNASLVVLNFTLQFLLPEDRQLILNKIYHGLNPGGVLVLSEKFSFEDKKINKLMINMHHDFKRSNGYSEIEIYQKSNMLENIMLTDSIETHKSRLYQAGFKHNELWFQYLNFGSLVAIKDYEAC